MKRTLTYSLLAVMAAGSMAAAQDRTSRFRSSSGSSGSVAPSNERPSDATPRPRKMEDPYTILQTTSIFARDRRTGPAVEPTNTTPPPNPETYYAFRGAAEENGKIVAFLEDTRDGSTMRYSVGEEIASGKITDITLDSLKYERRDGMLKSVINLGCDLSGRESAVAVADSSSSSSTSSNGSTSAPTGIDAINNYRGRGFNNGFGPGAFGSDGGFRQRGFGPSSFGSQGSYGADGGGYRQRGFDRSQGGGSYGQQDFGGGRRSRRDYGGGYGG